MAGPRPLTDSLPRRRQPGLPKSLVKQWMADIEGYREPRPAPSPKLRPLSKQRKQGVTMRRAAVDVDKAK